MYQQFKIKCHCQETGQMPVLLDITATSVAAEKIGFKNSALIFLKAKAATNMQMTYLQFIFFEIKKK